MENLLETFFSVAAQVVFTIFGFVLVALTLDKEARNYWFSDIQKKYTIIHLISLILPGLLSLIGTVSIPISPTNNFTQIRSWVFASILVEFIYIILLVEIHRKNQKQIQSEQTKHLKKNLWSFSIILFLLAIYSASCYFENIKTYIADTLIILYLTMGIVFGIVSILNFLENPKTENNISGNTDSEINQTNIQTGNKPPEKDSTSLVILCTAIIAFILGQLTKRKKS